MRLWVELFVVLFVYAWTTNVVGEVCKQITLRGLQKGRRGYGVLAAATLCGFALTLIFVGVILFLTGSP